MPRSARVASRLASASAWVRPAIRVPSRVRQIVAGSRPTASQWPSRTPIRWRTWSGVPNTLQASPYWATIRRVLRSPDPPMSTGGPPAVTGRGELRASRTTKCSPEKLVVSFTNIERMICRASSSFSNRSVNVPKRKP